MISLEFLNLYNGLDRLRIQLLARLSINVHFFYNSHLNNQDIF
jgi:hypothetical protein